VPVISLTPIGRYLIGERDDFVCKAAVNTGGVIVQPNFEIVFTAVNAVAECEIMRYAERIGKQVGVLFKITRDSILQSLDSAMTGAEVIESLQLCSGVQVPKNVVTQITDWCCSYRVVKLEKIHVINCPDAETALRVQSLFPKNAERINDTLVRVESDKSFSSLKSKLKSNGIGLVD
jgi:hypothetical protein